MNNRIFGMFLLCLLGLAMIGLLAHLKRDSQKVIQVQVESTKTEKTPVNDPECHDSRLFWDGYWDGYRARLRCSNHADYMRGYDLGIYDRGYGPRYYRVHCPPAFRGFYLHIGR